MRILLAEDEVTVARLITRVLGSLGHEVIGVTSCSEAIASLHSEGFDLVLLDLHLTDGDGYRVVEEIGGLQGCAPRVVVMTGERYPEDDPRAALVAGILRKPFDIDDLEQVVAHLGT
jgi:DNA-binding response OmpR family regulator